MYKQENPTAELCVYAGIKNKSHYIMEIILWYQVSSQKGVASTEYVSLQNICCPSKHFDVSLDAQNIIKSSEIGSTWKRSKMHPSKIVWPYTA